MLDRLADALAAAGDHGGAVATARRRLALDPLHEPAHRRLIQSYAAAGDRAAALEQYRECVRVLDRELGVRALDETTALYHAVLEGTFAAAPASAASRAGARAGARLGARRPRPRARVAARGLRRGRAGRPPRRPRRRGRDRQDAARA